MTKTMTTTTPRHGRLPPGQRAIDWFPRFGVDTDTPPPPVPADPAVEIGGAVAETFAVPISDLATLPRRRVDADFHCVSGWTAVGLQWDGVAFADFYRLRIEPELRPGAVITHFEFIGLDEIRAVVTLGDALEDDVLLADHLDGEPLSPDHGAPLRLVSPAQYGYINIKHLCRIRVHTSVPRRGRRTLADVLLHSHPRARVWEEERHGTLPGRLVRPVYGVIARVLLRKARSSGR